MSPQKRLRSIIARRARLEDAAARAQVRVLQDLRKAIMREILTASGYRVFRLGQMLTVIDAEIQQYRAAAERAIALATRQAWGLGEDLVLAAAPSIGVPGGLYGVSPQLLGALVDVTTDQTRAIWSELGTRLKGQIRRVTLGLIDPQEAVVAVARFIRDPKVFGTSLGRAEAIVRTEVNRTFSLSSYERQRQGDRALQAAGERLLKWWLHAGDQRVRDAHEAAGERYTAARAIPIAEAFIVGGEKLRYPLDPTASAENTVRCRCASVSRVVSAAEYAQLKRAA